MHVLSWILFGLTLVGLAVVLLNVSRLWPRPRLRSGLNLPDGSVDVLIPARNEERNLPRLLESLLQQGAVIRRIIVLDDRSTDRTPDIVREFSERDGRIELSFGAPLPDGWCGKCWACQQLGEQAEAQWVLFLDADTKLEPGAVGTMLATAKRYRVTQLSCWPWVEMRSLAEQACMPMLSFVVYSMFPAGLQRRMTEPSFGIAHGTCMLFDRATYRSLGAHFAVKASLFEDARMAQHWRRSGERGLCVDGGRLIRVRMYTNFAEIWEGFEKNMFACCGTHLRFFTWIGLRFLFFQLPLVAAPFYNYYRTPLLALWLAFAAVMLQRLLLAIYFRQPLWSVALHPLAEAGVLGVSLSSWLRIVTGRGVTWKGRVYRRVEEEALEPGMALDMLLSDSEPELSATEP